MPKIKDANRNCIAVLEDPRTARSQMYFYGDAVTKSSLSPVFGKHAHFSSTSGDYTVNHGRTDIGDFDNWVGDGRGLSLNKETASMNYSTDTGDVVSNNIPPGNFASMDPDKKWSGSQLHSEGSTSMVLLNSPGVKLLLLVQALPTPIIRAITIISNCRGLFTIRWLEKTICLE